MSEDIRKMIDKVKNFKQFVNESENKNTLDLWKDLMDKYDLKFFKEFQTKTKSDLEQMSEDWKAMRRYALGKLNQDLNNQGKSGQLLNIDVSDEELYPYIDDKSKQFLFLKYSRILDFSDGYRPKDFVLIKKGL
jgi:hypothetical protein